MKIINNANKNDYVILKEYNDFLLLAKIGDGDGFSPSFVCAHNYNGHDSWQHGNYYNDIDNALHYFNERAGYTNGSI